MAAQTATTVLSSLEDRITTLEKTSWNIREGSMPSSSVASVTPELRRARRHVQSSHCFSSQWKLCPSNYYALTLDERRAILGAHSTSQLCKACLFENQNYAPDDYDGSDGEGANDRTNARYYLVVVQYVESIDTKRLASELRGLRPPGAGRFGPSYFADLRLAPGEASERLTGYGHNGVSPFGMVDPSVPVVVCKSITEVSPRFVWMGGGDKDWKLGMAVSEFVRGLDAIVLDVSEPRAV